MSRVTWLHLSDWHQSGEDFDREVVRDRLMEDIRNRMGIAPKLQRIDFIVFSGDLAFHGAQSEYKAVEEYFLGPLLEAANLGDRGRERLFIVPGNHDLNRDFLDILPSNLLDTLCTETAVNAWLNDNRKLRALLEPMSEFRHFLSEYLGGYQNFEDQDPAYWHAHHLAIDGNDVGIACLNSSWLTSRNRDHNGDVNDYGHLILGTSQAHRAVERIKSSDLRIVVMHHPFEWLNQNDRSRIDDYLRNECHFILCGHQLISMCQILNSSQVLQENPSLFQRVRVTTDP